LKKTEEKRGKLALAGGRDPVTALIQNGRKGGGGGVSRKRIPASKDLPRDCKNLARKPPSTHFLKQRGDENSTMK